MNGKPNRPNPLSNNSTPKPPRHLLNPGEDGYRTPTIEDFNHSHDALQQSLPANLGHDGTIPGVQARDMLPNNEPKFFSEHKLRGGNTDDFWAEKLNWRQRIKHFTWAYFALTMATGGIANVLYIYFAVFAMMIRAIIIHQILWPQQGEDKNEGGFRVETWRPEGQDSPGGWRRTNGRRKGNTTESLEEKAAVHGDAAIELSYSSGNDQNV
ncbi:MAG: hypothetical protein Q9227_007093 [Pyrenula ochraceoflavens]